MESKEFNTRFYYLDALRAVAAFNVFLFHIHNANYFVIDGFWLSVDLFFILSGFVLHPQIININNKKYKKEFIVNRIIRLAPLPLLTIIFMCFRQRNAQLQMIKYIEPSSVVAIISAFLFLQVFSSQAVSVNLTLWSLSTEFWANILSIFFHSTKKCFLISILSGAILFLSIGAQFSQEYGISAFSRTCLSFNIGLLLRRYSHKFSYNPKILFLGIILLIPIFNLGGKTNYAVFVAIPIFSIIVTEISKIPQKTITTGVKKICHFLGRNSFGIYVWQLPINSLVQSKYIEDFFKMRSTSIAFDFTVIIIKFTTVLLISEFTIRFYETPIQKKLRNKLRKS